MAIRQTVAQKRRDKTVGVVLATYNGERYIGEQLESLFAQTVKPDVILVTDAGSTDGTVRICEQFIARNPDVKMRILKNESAERPLGVITNFEKGFTDIDTDYIFFCDQDDVWKPQKIENTINCLIETGSLLCFSDADVVDKELNSMGTGLWEAHEFQPKKNMNNGTCFYPGENNPLFQQLLYGNVVTGMTMCVTKSLKSVLLPFSEHGLHDAWIAILSSLTARSSALNEKLVLYRQHDLNQVGVARKSSKKKNFLQRKQKALERLFFLKDLEARLLREDIAVPQSLIWCIALEQKRVTRISELHFPTRSDIKDYGSFCRNPLTVMVKDSIYILYLIAFKKNG